MKIELISVVDMWEELRNCDIDRIKRLWDDDDIFESVSMDEFVDDVNEWYRFKEGFNFRGLWYLSDFENVNEFGVLSKGGDYLERDLDIEE